jgi:hypothetical protein
MAGARSSMLMRMRSPSANLPFDTTHWRRVSEVHRRIQLAEGDSVVVKNRVILNRVDDSQDRVVMQFDVRQALACRSSATN